MFTVNRNIFLFLIAVLFACYVFANDEGDVGKLPHCVDSNNREIAVLIGTLDGRITAVNSVGDKIWDVDTGPGPLLVSNIHKLELTNNGQWIRIIPSLSGSLYKFDGKTIDPIQIDADSLLKSSFLYSDDLVIAGGREVRTYGVAANSGKFIYECSLKGCHNKTDYETEAEDVIVIERSTFTVRAHEPRSGAERWNFSVGSYNIKIPHISCINQNLYNDFEISAIIPDGLLNAYKNKELLWQYQLMAPIVSVWKNNGKELVPVDLFSKTKTMEDTSLAADLYVGMHRKQLYIHESVRMLNSLATNRYDKVVAAESKSVAKIPWKPIPASQLAVIPAEHDDSTALSVLYSSEYVNGHGYYLFKENIQQDNSTNTILPNENDKEGSSFFHTPDSLNLLYQIIILLIFTYLVKTILNFLTQKIYPIERKLENLKEEIHNKFIQSTWKEKQISESADTYSSRYSNDFETVRRLGSGGFGVVFEVRKKIDECHYAIKRIELPNEKNSKDLVMREVKILAKLDHPNIVRYYNSWVESPSVEWIKKHDELYLSDESMSNVPTSPSFTCSHKRSCSTVIDIERDSSTDDPLKLIDRNRETTEDDTNDGIFFEKGTDEEDNSATSLESISQHSKFVAVSETTPLYLYIQMQLCKKDSLQEWLQENKERNYDVSLNNFSQILNAVDYIHENDLIHRDLKPSNIFFSKEGTIKVGDFGLVTRMKETVENENAHLLANTLEQSHTKGVGTLLYMSPEQLEGKKYNYKVDIWSLGIIFFELLNSFSTGMERNVTLTKITKQDYPASFMKSYAEEHELLKKMLSTDPDNRPTISDIKKEKIFQHKLINSKTF